MDSATALNRQGKWGEASRLASAFLAGRSSQTKADDLCPVRTALLYSRVRLHQLDSAKVTLAAIDQECTCTPSMNGYTAEIAGLRREIPGAPAAPAPVVTATQSGPPAIAPAVDRFWKVASPATMGLDATALNRHRLLCERTGADACLVIYRGTIVQEWYSSKYVEPIGAMSSTKSITGLLTGMLIADRKIGGIDDPVCKFLPSWCAGIRGRVTVGHLLSMTAGLPAMPDSSVGYKKEKNVYVMSLQPTSEPGTTWAYSNESAQLLSPILDKAAGGSIAQYARARLFEPLGMTHTNLKVDASHEAWTYAEMATTPRELARIGLLMLNRGVWQGRRIVSENWVDAATHASQSLNRGYGLLWYVDPVAKAFATHGHLDTSMHVIPDLDLIVVRMQAKPLACGGEGDYEAAAVPMFRGFVAAAQR